jgi:hypothetical protein
MELERPKLSQVDAGGFPIVSFAASDEPFVSLQRSGTDEEVQPAANKAFVGLAILDDSGSRVRDSALRPGTILFAPRDKSSLTLKDEKLPQAVHSRPPCLGPVLDKSSQVRGMSRRTAAFGLLPAIQAAGAAKLQRIAGE